MSDISLHQLVELEFRVWIALVAGDASADRELLAPDFLGVYETGFANRAGHVEQLANGPSVFSYDIFSPVMRPLGTDHVLLSYEAVFRRKEHQPAERMYVSSIGRTATMAGSIVSLLLRPRPPQPEDPRTTEAYILNMHVPVEHQRRGIGTASAWRTN